MIPSWGYPPQKRPDPGRYDRERNGAPSGVYFAEILSRNSAMRETEASGWIDRNVPEVLTRPVRLGVVALGLGLAIGIVMTAAAARAGDDDDDERSVEEKIIGGIIAGVGGTNMDNRGIDY